MDPTLPGADLIERGLADLARGIESVEALLVWIDAVPFRDPGRLVLVGLTIGLMAAYNTNQLVAHFLYGTTPTDPVTMAAVSVGVLALALLAAYIPARRTLAIDPVEVLRSE